MATAALEPTADIKAALVASLAARRGEQATEIERVLITGDLSKLTPEQRLSYYNTVCASLGLNPLTKPFAYITLNGKLVLYALKDATEQLRKLHSVSITELTSLRLEDVFVVTAKAQDKTGRTDAATGAVPIGNLKGEALANALMKAETKAKRRATLSICGLGILDETETETIPHQEPPLVLVAAKRIELPAGSAQILKVEPRAKGAIQWADVTFVTDEGVEHTLPLPGDPKGAPVMLCEQLVQEGAPVLIESKVGQRSGKTSIASVKRWTPQVELPADSNASIDAEIASREGAF